MRLTFNRKPPNVKDWHRIGELLLSLGKHDLARAGKATWAR